jgi:hypothetical protein
VAIAFRNSSVLAPGTRTTSTINLPSGTIAGDEVRIYLTGGLAGGTAPTFTPPGDATLVASTTYVGSGPFTVRVSVYRYRADGSDPASFAFTHSSLDSDGGAVSYSGVDGTTPDDATATTNSVGSGSGLAAAESTTLTTVTADALLLPVRGSWDGNAITAPAGYTERIDQPVSWVGESVQASPGATGVVSIPHGNSNNNLPWGVIMQALRPDTTPPPSFTNLIVQPIQSGRAWR